MSLVRLAVRGVPDATLIDQLYGFRAAVLVQWTYDDLASLGSNTHVEYRGPQEALLTFAIRLLEHEPSAPRPYIHISVTVCDCRDSRTRGSVYAPLSNDFIWFKDGTIDLADIESAREVG